MKRGLMFLLLCASVQAALITVSPQDTEIQGYTKIESAQVGDIVEIEPGTYRYRVFLDNDGTTNNPIIIRAQDPNDRPVWDMEGQNPADWPGSYTAGDRGRATWQIRGSHYIVSDIEFIGAHISSGDSSGIRTVEASDIIVRNCLFEDNDNGIQGDGDNIIYEFCEFYNNGNPNIAGLCHNIYTHGGDFTIRYSYIHDPEDGQNFHMRTENALFAYNIIENGGSYMGDIMTDKIDRSQGEPITQTLTMLGNLIIEKDDPANDAQVFVTYNDNQWPGTSFRFNMYYNTFIGNGKNAALAHITDMPGTVNQEWYLYNNIFYGNTRPFRIDISSGFHAESQNNWWPTGDYSEWSQYMSNEDFGTNPFIDLAGQDYRLNTDISADTGVGQQALNEPYIQMQYRLRESASDIGAYETGTDSAIVGLDGYNHCPPLYPASGNTVTVSTATELTNAINSAAADTTILLNDGTYNVRDLQLDTSGLTLRSVSGNRDTVILDGEYQGGSILNVRADHVTIADLTIKRSWYHPIHVGGGGHYVKIYNVKIIDGKEQFIKVNPNGGQHNDYGEVACSHLELTPVGRQYIHNNPTPGYPCYTGGLDLHQSWGWIVRDNTIKDIYCTNGGLAEHAIHFWQTNRDSIVERNTIVNCARGIGFGLGSQGNDRIYPDDPLAGNGVDPAIVDHIGGMIRNNFIFSDTTEYDTGIGLEAAWNVTVAHNTIYGKAGNSWNSAIDTRFAASNPVLVNNLYYPKTTVRNSGTPTEINNVLATAGMFIDMDNADLHLTQGASVIDQGTAGHATVDNDGNLRDSQPDIGADEYGSHTPVCTPMSISELNQIIYTWKSGTTAISELMTAIGEWKRGCN